LITEMLVEKRLGQRRLELTDELYQTWREVEQRGLKETREYRDVLLGADRHAFWLAGLVKLAASPISSEETKRTDTLDAPKKPLSKLVNQSMARPSFPSRRPILSSVARSC
jgi:hypothetical protein